MQTEDERLEAMDTSRRGTTIICRDYKGRPLVRRVWSETAAAAYIHDEENYQKHAQGLACLSCVGFPRKDVFIYDEAALATYATPELWEHLVSFGRAEKEMP